MGALTTTRQQASQYKHGYENVAREFKSIELIIDDYKGLGQQQMLDYPIKGLTEYGNASYSFGVVELIAFPGGSLLTRSRSDICRGVTTSSA